MAGSRVYRHRNIIWLGGVAGSGLWTQETRSGSSEPAHWRRRLMDVERIECVGKRRLQQKQVARGRRSTRLSASLAGAEGEHQLHPGDVAGIDLAQRREVIDVRAQSDLRRTCRQDEQPDHPRHFAAKTQLQSLRRCTGVAPAGGARATDRLLLRHAAPLRLVYDVLQVLHRAGEAVVRVTSRVSPGCTKSRSTCSSVRPSRRAPLAFSARTTLLPARAPLLRGRLAQFGISLIATSRKAQELVTGASRGIGLEIARAALENGDCVVCSLCVAACDDERPTRIERRFPLTLTETEGAQSSVQ